MPIKKQFIDYDMVAQNIKKPYKICHFRWLRRLVLSVFYWQALILGFPVVKSQNCKGNVIGLQDNSFIKSDHISLVTVDLALQEKIPTPPFIFV